MTDEEMAGLLGGSSRGPRKALTDEEMAAAMKPVEPSHDIPVGVRAPEPEPGVWQRLGQSLTDAGRTVSGGARAIYDTARHPLDTIRDPAKRRQLERGVDDMVTLGAGQRLAGWLGDKLGDTPETSLRATQAADNAAEPDYRAAGNLVGGVIPGATSLAGRAGAGLANRALGGVAAKGAASGAVMGAAKGLLGYEAAAVPTAAASAAIAGDDPLAAARSVATNPLGLAMAGGGGAVSGAGRGAAAHIRDPKELSGRVLRDVEAAGGKVRPFGEPARGGLYETPEIADSAHGRAGVNEFANKRAQAILEHNRNLLNEARQSYADAADAILGEHADKYHLPQATHAALDAADAENRTSAGAVIDTGQKAKLDHIRKLLTVDTGQLDHAASAATGQPVTVQAPAAKVSDLIKVKKFVNDMADWKNPVTPDSRPYRLIYGALGQDAEAVDPRVGQMNQQFAATAKQLEQANQILFGKRATDIADSPQKLQSAAAKLGRIGDDTQAGTTAQPQLDQLRQLDPEYDRQLRLMAAKKAQERLRYGGGGETSTSIESGMGRAVERGAHRVGGAVLGHAVGGPLGGAVGAELAGAVNNPLALKLRLGLPAAEAIGNRNPVRGAVITNRLTELARKRREEQAQAAQLLTGGGAQ